MGRFLFLLGFLTLAPGLGAQSKMRFTDPAQRAVDAVLTAFHQAASDANRKGYFGLLADQAVFLGTDGSERWTKREFEAAYGPYMDSGRGWTYLSSHRNITIGTGGAIAWFDEALSSEGYGPCRGSGVLVKTEKGWRIAQYNLSIPIPNGIAKSIVEKIKAVSTKDP